MLNCSGRDSTTAKLLEKSMLENSDRNQNELLAY
jgi:hypothetical protein